MIFVLLLLSPFTGFFTAFLVLAILAGSIEGRVTPKQIAINKVKEWIKNYGHYPDYVTVNDETMYEFIANTMAPFNMTPEQFYKRHRRIMKYMPKQYPPEEKVSSIVWDYVIGIREAFPPDMAESMIKSFCDLELKHGGNIPPHVYTPRPKSLPEKIR